MRQSVSRPGPTNSPIRRFTWHTYSHTVIHQRSEIEEVEISLGISAQPPGPQLSQTLHYIQSLLSNFRYNDQIQPTVMISFRERPAHCTSLLSMTSPELFSSLLLWCLRRRWDSETYQPSNDVHVGKTLLPSTENISGQYFVLLSQSPLWECE